MKDERSNGARIDFDRGEVEQSIPRRFLKIVAQFPDRIAVAAQANSLSYRELDAESDRIARRILDLRGDRAEPVCLLVEQGANLVAAILGALRAGKIYVALDPRHPLAELRHFVEHSGAGCFLCDGANRALAAELAGAGACLLDIGESPVGSGAVVPDPELAPDRPAYIFYTSGSTGTPKGVVDCHRNVLHNVMRYTNNLGIGPEDRLSMIQSCSFSGTVSSLFGALLNGAAICPFDLQSLGIDAMASWLAREEITIFHSVPAIFEQLSDVAPALPNLRLIRLEGDRSEPRHLRRFNERFGPHTTLVNGLGATETGIVRQFFFRHGDPVPEAVVPIGHPVTGMVIRLVDEDGSKTEPGEIGEITVASHYLASGYWRDPELTARAFTPDPEDSGRRVYRTRDLGRMLPDGCLEYLGRKDFQAKLRGIRIDLPAIEAALGRQSGVERALAMVREDLPGRQQLVAYIEAQDGAELSITVLRRALEQTLPAIMVPARFVVLGGFPLDKNLKIDRRALPPPGTTRPQLDTAFRPPETERQNVLAACFREILGLEKVGLDDDFFELGGDSLLATELLLLLEHRLGTLCPADFLYSAPSVAGLDCSFDGEARLGDLVALQPDGGRTPLFCIHGTSGYALEFRDLARLMPRGQPVYGVQNRAVMTRPPGTPPPSVGEMAAAAADAIRRAHPNGPYRLCGNCYGGVIALETGRYLRELGHVVDFIGLIDSTFLHSTLRSLAPARSIGTYLSEFNRVPRKEKASYAIERIRNYLARAGGRAWLYVRHLARRPRRMLGLGEIKIGRSEIARASRAGFRLRDYDGPVTLFSAGAPDHRGKWRQVLPRLSVVEIGKHAPAARPHLIGEPLVRAFAPLFIEHLEGRAARPEYPQQKGPTPAS